MSMFSLPANLQIRLGLLKVDPEFKELLKAIPAPRLPRFRRSPSQAGAKQASDYQQQMHEWIFLSGMVAGHELLLSHFGIKPTLKETETRD